MQPTDRKIPPHRKEAIKKEIRKYGGPRPKGSKSEARLRQQNEAKQKFDEDKGFAASEFATSQDKRAFINKYDRPGNKVNFPRLGMQGPRSRKNWKKVKEMIKTDKPDATPFKKGGRAEHNIGGRANLLEEMGRIDARRHPDAADRAEKRRVIGELNRGYKKGGLIKGKPKLAKKGWK